MAFGTPYVGFFGATGRGGFHRCDELRKYGGVTEGGEACDGSNLVQATAVRRRAPETREDRPRGDPAWLKTFYGSGDSGRSCARSVDRAT